MIHHPARSSRMPIRPQDASKQGVPKTITSMDAERHDADPGIDQHGVEGIGNTADVSHRRRPYVRSNVPQPPILLLEQHDAGGPEVRHQDDVASEVRPRNLDLVMGVP
ncbi:hypothetical protein [Nonomuraea rubra]|uniref:Uncharacterized protein n=1 Tax=Nonomuraea rubra TaxID=46180 RepID=A0A7X0NV29_9ACTN|nr:hypothetical protein [Nonomuraea rubra]MBB6550194.1 hypothetical protein [Nonomuraea rubra]